MKTVKAPSTTQIVTTSQRPLVLGGAIFSTVSALLFALLHIPDLPVHFQWDGQLAEYLSWTEAPEHFEGTLNAQLNPRLYSAYYPAAAWLHQRVERMTLLGGLYVGELMFLGLATYICGWLLVRDALAAVLLSIAVIWGNVLATTLGGGGGVGLVCNPEYPATAIILICLGLSFRGHHRLAILGAASAFNLHGSLAIFGAGLIFGAAVLDLARRRKWLRIAQVTMLGLAAAAPTAYWALSDMPNGGAAWAAETWWQFPYWIFPHHIYVSTSPWSLWLGFAGLILPALVGWNSMRDRYSDNRAILLGWSLAAASLLLIGFVFVEWYPVRLIAQLTLWRGTRFVLVIALAFGLHWLTSQFETATYARLLAALSLLTLIGVPVAGLNAIGWACLGILTLISRRGGTPLGLVLSALAAIIFVGLTLQSFKSSGLNAAFAIRLVSFVIVITLVWVWTMRDAKPIRMLAATMAFLALFCFLDNWNLGTRLPQSKARRAAALATLAPALQNHSMPGNLVVAPPELRNPGAWAERGSFLCRQQLTAYAYGPWLVPELIERMRCIDGGVDDGQRSYSLARLAEKYRNAGPSVFVTLRDKYGVRLAITERNRQLPYRRVALNDEFCVYDLAATE